MDKLFKPGLYKFKGDPQYFVGCDTETAHNLYLSEEAMLKHVDDHAYIAAFNASGEKVGEVKVVDYDPKRHANAEVVDHAGAAPDGLYFQDDF